MSQRHVPAVPAVGFVSPPRWVSPSLVEFPAVVAAPVVPQQCIPCLSDFGYSLAEIAAAGDAVETAARLLGEAGCSAVAMEGAPFAWAGADGEAVARARVDALALAAGVPAVMAGTAIIDALRAVGAGTVALCPTYYPADWRDAWGWFVEACGFRVAYCRTLADERLSGPITDNDTYGWDMTPELITAAVERAVETAGESDAVVVTGAGCRTTPIVAQLERIIARPVIGADSATFWAVAEAAGLRLRRASLGRLTDCSVP